MYVFGIRPFHRGVFINTYAWIKQEKCKSFSLFRFMFICGIPIYFIYLWKCINRYVLWYLGILNPFPKCKKNICLMDKRYIFCWIYVQYIKIKKCMSINKLTMDKLTNVLLVVDKAPRGHPRQCILLDYLTWSKVSETRLWDQLSHSLWLR